MKTRRAPIDAERLALERELRQFWSRLQDQLPTRTERDLPVLQRALAEGRIVLSLESDRRGLGIALGTVLVHELDLQWVRLADDWGVEMGLSRTDSDIVAHPLPMIADRADAGQPIDLVALFHSIGRQFGSRPLEIRLADAAVPWRAELGRPGPGLDELEHRLGILAAQLQRGGDLSFVMIRGVHFSISVDAGRGNVSDLTMQVSFAGERAMLVVGGGRSADSAHLAIHAETRKAIELAIAQHLATYPESLADFPPFTDDAAGEPHPATP